MNRLNLRTTFTPRALIGSTAVLAVVAVMAFGLPIPPSLVGAQSAGAFSVGEALVVDTDSLNLRAGGTTSAAVTAVLPTGADVTIVSGPVSVDGYSWYNVSTAANGSGFVAGDYLSTAANATTVAAAATSPGFAVGQGLVVDTDLLNLRGSATTVAASSATLASGDAVTILDGPVSADGYSWYQVSSGAGDGWVAGDYLATVVTLSSATDFLAGETVVVDTDALNLRADAAISAAVDVVLITGDAGTVVSGPVSADGSIWYQISTSAGTGWVDGSFLATA